MGSRFYIQILSVLLVVIAVASFLPDYIENNLAAHAMDVSPMEPGPELTALEVEQEVIRLVNLERERAGRRPLKASSRLTEVARIRSRDMASRGYFDHRDPETRELLFYELLLERGLDGGGENLFLAQVRSWEVPTCAVQWWMNSRLHYMNIMRSDYRQTGVGVTIHAGRIYITQVFL